VVRKICVDSDVLIELLRNNEKVKSVLVSLDADFFITTVNYYEVWGGRKDEEIISPFLDNFVVIDFDKSSSIIAGNIRKKLREKGDLVDVRDIFIASSCINSDLELLTLNLKHFERMKKFGLKLVKV
jgi:tRNA(fMet)-specific endonuclease VapC